MKLLTQDKYEHTSFKASDSSIKTRKSEYVFFLNYYPELVPAEKILAF